MIYVGRIVETRPTAGSNLKRNGFLMAGGQPDQAPEAAVAEALRFGHRGGAEVDGFTWESVPPDNGLIALAQDRRRNLSLTLQVAAGAVPGTGEVRAAGDINLTVIRERRPLHYQVA